MFWNRQTLREKPSRILEDWGKDKRKMQKKIDELEAASARLFSDNSDLEAKLTKAVELFKWMRLAVEEAEEYSQMGRKLEEIITYPEFKALEEIEKGE